MKLVNVSIKERLLSRRILKESGCWEFDGHIMNTGYGEIRYLHKTWLVHRLSLKAFKPDEYKEELDVLHSCNNRKCFNPDHLRSGTQSENNLDAAKLGKMSGFRWNSLKTHCPSGHEYTPENTRFAKNGSRKCKTCQKISNAMRLFKDKE